MKNLWRIALNDLKIMVRDKAFFFWFLAFPMLFILIFGNLFKDDSGDPRATLHVINKDKGQWGAYFTDKIKSPAIDLKIVQQTPENYLRLLEIPPDFSEKIARGEAQKLLLTKEEGANANAARQVETRIIQSIARIITELIIHPDPASFFNKQETFRDLISVKTHFPEGAILKTPTGFDHLIPGITLQFIMMMTLIYGGVTVMTDRKRGILNRISFSSTSKAELWGGKYLGRLLTGIVQAFILVTIGKLFFNLNLGNLLFAIINIVIFSSAIASISIFIGSIMNKEDMIVGVSILAGNMFSGLGGCWWPIEVVPESIRAIGMISPAYWAMDVFHKIIFFKKGLPDIMLNWFVLLGVTLLFTILAVRFFKIRD